MGETIAREYVNRLSITIIRPPAVYGLRDSTKAEKEIGYCAKFPIEKGIKNPPVGTQITAGFDLMLRPSLNLRNEWNADLRSLNRVQMRTT